MTPPSHSLLVLAWDDADPGAHPATAPPTLPVLRHLAAHRPLLAVLPALPAAVQTPEYQAEVAARQPAETPAPSATTGLEEATPPSATEEAHFETNVLLGTVLLPLTTAGAGVGTSHLIGLADLGDAPAGSFAPEAPTAAPTEADSAETGESAVAPASAQPPDAIVGSARTLPKTLATFAHSAPRPAEAWAAPAAPYLGSSQPPRPEPSGSTEAAGLPEASISNPRAEKPVPAALEGASGALTDSALGTSGIYAPATPAPAATRGSAASETTAATYPKTHPQAPLARDEAPAAHHLPPPYSPATPPDDFAQTAAEVGPGEAADLHAAEDKLTLVPDEAPAGVPSAPLPEAPERASLAQALHSLHRSAPEPAPGAAIDLAAADLPGPEPLPPSAPPPLPLSDNLHYRIIQYARFAAHVAAEQQERFGVIYAPNWPTWLAALEIRYRSRRPLVLHLTELAAATAAPAERGWRLELERYALRRAHTILVATDALRRQLLRHYGHLPGRLRVIAPTDEAGLHAILAKVGTVADF